MNSLYAEVIGCVIAASLLGLFAGWMMQRARATRRLSGTISVWEAKYRTLESRSGEDSTELETRLQSLGEQLRSLTDEKRELASALAERDAGLERARHDAIELNRQQAGIQERLQRIIRKKDQTLASLGADAANLPAKTSLPAAASGETTSPSSAMAGTAANASGHAAAGAASAGSDVEAYIDRLSDRGERHRDEAQRVSAASNLRKTESPDLHALSNEDSFDATALLDLDVLTDDISATQLLDPLDATETEAMGFEDDESTIAFDEETLARVRGHHRD